MHKFRSLLQRLSVPRHEPEPEPEPPEPGPPSHALDLLPTLPTPRRPITAIAPNPQLGSTFFKLPPELRQQVYRLLLSGRELHLDMRYSAAETTTPHSTRGATLDARRRWRWRASTCHRHPDAQAVSDRCGWGGPPPTACAEFDTPCGVGREVLGLLLCCRLAYREAVDILYAENTFHVGTGALVLYTDRLLPRERSGAVTSLIYRVTPETVLDYAQEHLGLERGWSAYLDLLHRIPQAFPSLKKLHIILSASVLREVWQANENPLSFAYRDTQDWMKHCMLCPVDITILGYEGRLEEGVLIMDHKVFDYLAEDQRATAKKIESEDGRWLQIWRPVVGVPEHWGVLTSPPDMEPVHTGYWVRRVSPKEDLWFPRDLDAQLALPE